MYVFDICITSIDSSPQAGNPSTSQLQPKPLPSPLHFPSLCLGRAKAHQRWPTSRPTFRPPICNDLRYATIHKSPAHPTSNLQSLNHHPPYNLEYDLDRKMCATKRIPRPQGLRHCGSVLGIVVGTIPSCRELTCPGGKAIR